MKAVDPNVSFSSQYTTQTGRSTSSNSSLSSRYGLDEDNDSPVLVYEYRGDVEVIPQKELARRVNRDPSKRVTRMSIPRGTATLDVHGSDLCLPEEKNELQHNAAYWVNLASVPVPRNAYWRRLLLGDYDELFIVSPESSPENSQYDGESRKVSPSSTWEYGSQDVDTQPGAQN